MTVTPINHSQLTAEQIKKSDRLPSDNDANNFNKLSLPDLTDNSLINSGPASISPHDISGKAPLFEPGEYSYYKSLPPEQWGQLSPDQEKKLKIAISMENMANYMIKNSEKIEIGEDDG